MSNLIDDTRVRDICKIGQGAECCRFLVGGSQGFECAKHIPSLASHLNMRVLIEDIVARGNNCDGLK